ncbi:MAG: radical SAM protein [Anaerolineales bacterium]|nr:radical SAM protein [Anaerolineales bacterium]
MYNKVIVIEVSTICNLSCPFCAHDKRLPIPRHTIPAETLTSFTQIVGQYAAAKDEAILVSWLGGEPFLQPNLLPLTERLHEQYPLYFSATTNGTQLHKPEIRDHIQRCYAELTFSVDGFSDFHNLMRGKTGLFDEVKTHIQQLACEAPNLKLRINTVLMRENFDAFPALCAELARWGVNEITFNQLGGRDRPEFYPDHHLTVEQVQRLPEMAQQIQTAIRETGAHLVFSPSYFKRISASARGEKLPILDCAPGCFYLFVNAHGHLAPCTFTLDEYGKPLESIRSPTDFEQLPFTFHREKMSAQASACLDCPNTNVHGKFS